MAGNMIKRGVNIYIDQSEAQKAIEILQLKFQKLTNDMQALENQGKKGSKEWNRLSTNLQKVDADLKEVSSEVKLTELSMKQLESVKARLNAQLRTAIPGSEQWKQYANGIQTCETRLQELRAGARNTDGAINKLDNSVVKHQSSMTKLANSFNKYQALALGFIASITGVAFALKNVIREFAKLDDVFANVSKNTGLTIEEVKALDEKLKAYDTRTAREELLKLASEAGKAGETGVDNLNGIVQSLDKIKVALGEDLGEDAITDLLKIANVSGLKDMMGTADAINAIGSAVNELGQKSVAKEAYIISFTQRLGGVAKQANISAQNIMGFASALDQAGMNVEMSSTALQQFLMKMMEDPAKFAKIAGLEVKSFTELVAKDTNAAIIQMLEAMHNKGGFQALIPMFSDMGTEGVRAVSVLSTLAGQIQGVKEAQELSNTAFAEGNSLTEEFNKRNNNAQAELDKAKKKFLENSVALGEKLYPAMKMSLSGASYLIKALGFLANNFYALIPLIGACTIALIAYNKQKMITWALDVKGTLQAYKWMLAETIKQNLIGKTTILTKAAAVAQALWNTAITATGVGGMIILLGSLVTTLLLVTGAFDKTTKAQKALNEAQKATNDHMADEKARIEVLIAQIKNENLSREERNKKLKDLIAISPEYLSSLDLENIKTAKGTKIIEDYLKQLERKIHLQNLEKELANADKEIEEAKSGESLWWLQKFNDKEGWIKKETEDAQKVYDEIKNKIESYIASNPTHIDPFQEQINELERLRQAGEITKDEYTKMMIELKQSQKNENSTFTPTPTDDDKKPWEKEIKALEDNLKLSKAINEKALLEKNINEEQYNRLNLEAEKLFYNNKLKVLQGYNQATGDVELEIMKNRSEQQKLAFNQDLQLNKEIEDAFLLDLEKKYQRGEMSEKAYKARLLGADVAFLEMKMETLKKYGDDTTTIEKDILTKRKELRSQIDELIKTDEEKLVDDPNENPALSENMKLDAEEAILKNKYKNNLINKQEYEDEMEKIAKKRWDNEISFIEKYFDIAVNSTQKMGEAVSGFKDAELTKAETNYTKEEKALDSKLKRGLISQQEYDTQKNALEEKYQEEQKAIKKKYAGVELVISIGKIIAETALAVMSSFGQLGPIAGIPFAAIMAAVGASQIALATAQYQQIQGLEQGLYPTVTRQQDGKKFKVNSVGNMQTGVYSQPSVLVGEAGPELVVDNKRFNKIMKERPEVINYIVNGFEKGKYPTISQNAIKIAKGSGDSKLQAAIDQLLISINESDIYVLRKKLRKADKTISDINNKFN